MNKQRIQKPTLLREQVYALIMSYIRNGIYQADDHLTEKRVAKDLGVSRTPVREALSQLHTNRLLVSRKNGGYLVRSLSIEEIAHIFEVRMLIEPHAIACIAKLHTEKELQTLEALLQKEIQHADEKNPDAFAVANEEFRTAMFGGLANTELKRCISQFDDYMQLIRLATLIDFSTRQIVISGHKEIIAAISTQNVKSVEAAMRRHIENAERCVIEAMEKDQNADALRQAM